VAEFGDEPLAPSTPAPRAGKAGTIAEAEQAARQLNLANTISYKGLAVDTANAINKSIAEALRAAPALRDNLRFVGSIQERNRYFVKAYTDQELEKLRALGIYSADDLAMHAKRLKAIARRIVGRPGARTFAESLTAGGASGDLIGGISVNDRWGGSVSKWLKSLEAGVESGFHPTGTATIKAVIDHEVGHQLDDLLKLTTRSQVLNARLAEIIGQLSKSEVGRELSVYATHNFRELVAEAWMEYRNSQNPRPLANKIGKMIDELLAKLREANAP
jgi:hypothetical protein